MTRSAADRGRAGAEAAVPRLADGRGERAGSPPPAPARPAVWSRQRRLRGSKPNSCRPGALRGPGGAAAAPQVSKVAARGLLGRWAGEGLLRGVLAATNERWRTPSAAGAAPGRPLPAGPGRRPALPCGRSLSPPGPLPGSPARRHRRLHAQPADRFLQAGLSPGASGFSTCAHHVPVYNCVGFAWVCCLPFSPFVLLPREHATGDSCRGADRPPQPTSVGHGFLALNLSACCLLTDFKNRRDVAGIAYILSVILITSHWIHQQI